jgi:hypothetical protein
MIEITPNQAAGILELLELYRASIDGQIDVKDGPDGPEPNDAMINAALADANINFLDGSYRPAMMVLHDHEQI